MTDSVIKPRPRRLDLILPAGIVLACAIVAVRLPLLGSFGYDYAAAIALLVPLVPGIFFLRILDRPGAAAPELLRVLALGALCLAIPPIVGLAGAVMTKPCAPGEGLLWYALLPAAGMIWTGALAWFCAAFRKRYLLYLASLAAVMIHPLLLGYFTPRVDSYNFIYGYFPGFTYDEDLLITPTLVHWRLVTLVCAAALSAAGVAVRERRRERARPQDGKKPAGPRIAPGTAVLCSTLLVLAWVFRTDLGFETTSASLRSELGSAAQTRHFRIYYDSSAISPDEMRWVAAEHEFRFGQVSRFLETDTTRVIESYLYPDAGSKRRLTGAGNTDIAKPWRGEIHLDGESWRGTLKHEITHVLASEFGMPVIGANINIGLVEGLATAASPSFGNRTLQEYAASMMHFGIVEDPAALIRPAGFAFQASTVSYVLMGAFCRDLIGRRGIGPFKSWYGGASTVEAYGTDTDSLVAEWKRSLARIRVPAEWREHTEYYFRRGSIFARECARTVANLNEAGTGSLHRRDFDSARSSFLEALGISWNASSFAGLVRALLAGGDHEEAIERFQIEAGDSLKRGSVAGVRILYGDALMMRGDYPGARSVYETIRRLDLSPGANEAAAIRLQVTRAYDLRGYLAPVIAGVMDDTASFQWLAGLESSENAALLDYLRGRLLLARRDYAGALQAAAGHLGAIRDPELYGAVADLAGSAAFRLGDFGGARGYFAQRLANNPGPVLKAATEERLERCDWYASSWSAFASPGPPSR